MTYSVHHLRDGVYHIFAEAVGTLIVRIVVDGDRGEVGVYEQMSAIAAIGLPDEAARELPITKAARNRFGTGLVLRCLRAVKEAMPEIKVWVTDNREKSSTARGRVHERSY